MSAAGTAVEMAAAMRRGDRVAVLGMVSTTQRDGDLWRVVMVLAHLSAQGLDATLGQGWPDDLRLAVLDDDLPDAAALLSGDPGAHDDPEQ